MITHEEARYIVQVSTSGLDMRDKLHNYISQQEKLQAEHEALKKRNEPKKVVFNEKDTVYVGCADCPSCSATIDKDILTGVTNFCPHCGQALDWGK